MDRRHIASRLDVAPTTIDTYRERTLEKARHAGAIRGRGDIDELVGVIRACAARHTSR